ncbi:MAG TPA: methyltransferase domain-containing protein [Stellaceae bacterium]
MSWTEIAAAVRGVFGRRPARMPEPLPPAEPEALPNNSRAPEGPAIPPNAGLTLEEIVTALYRGLFEREPDPGGFEYSMSLLRGGMPVEELVRAVLKSAEFVNRAPELLGPAEALPDLIRAMPERYEWPIVRGNPMPVYVAKTDADMALMESLIRHHRYYDRGGVWSASIDIDKEITAAIVRGLGAHSCFELGCFTGPVLSLLADAGVEVLGNEVSATALACAYPNIRAAIRLGDLLSIDLNRRFDVVLCMDVLEHISPLRLPVYLERLLSLVEDDGYVYLNSPMWGTDRIFGIFEEQYIEEWQQVGDASYWRHWPCDAQGWPVHGHLVWASPAWWERTFEAHGLVRDAEIERAIHHRLGDFFTLSIGRRCLFVLRRPGNRKPSAEVASAVDRVLAKLPALSQQASAA